MNNFNIGDKVLWDGGIVTIRSFYDDEFCKVRDNSDGISYHVYIEDLKPYIEEGTKQEKDYNELLEENEELKELLERKQAIIKMMVELIWQL